MPPAFPLEFATYKAKPMMRIPVATYRLQFNPDFGFDAATVITPCLVGNINYLTRLFKYIFERC